LVSYRNGNTQSDGDQKLSTRKMSMSRLTATAAKIFEEQEIT